MLSSVEIDTLFPVLQYSNKPEQSRKDLISRRVKKKAAKTTLMKASRLRKKLGVQRRVPITMLICGTWKAQKRKMI